MQKCFRLIGAQPFRIFIGDLRWLVSVPDALNTTLEEKNIVAEAEIALQCSSFIRKSEDGRCFEFSHFTVREFLSRQSLLDDREFAGYCVLEPIPHATLAQQCLKLLQLGNFDHKPSLDRDGQIKHALDRNRNGTSYSWATVVWLAEMRSAPRNATCLELVKSLFDPRKSPSFISWAVQLVAHLISPDSFCDEDSVSLQQAISLVLDPTFRPIHLAALLDLPEICEYLVHTDCHWNSVSPLGTPLECSLGRMYCLVGKAWQPPPSTWFRPVDSILYATHRPGQAAKLLKKAGSVVQNTPKTYTGKSLMACATSSAIVSLDFSPVSYLITMGWVVSNEEATTFKERIASLLQIYPRKYIDGPHSHKTRLTASLLDLIKSLTKFRIFDSDPGYSMCATAWNAAVELACDFTEDVSLMDTRITLSLDALIRKCGVAISNNDGDLMRIYLGDPRISGPETIDDGTEACGYSLLRQAIVKNSARVLKAFCDRGYDFNRVVNGLQPIHEAWDCNEETLGLLLQAGASHLDRDMNGNSIWHLAASKFKTGTLSALLTLTGDEKIQALQMQNKEGYTPLTLAIHSSIQLPKDGGVSRFNIGLVNATIKLMSDTCEGDELYWRCPGSPWDLAAQSGSEVVVQCLHKSGVPLAPIQEGGSTPLHFLGEFASKDCVEFLMKLFPTSRKAKLNGLTPLESFIDRCLRADRTPQPGVIEVLAYDNTPADLTESNCSLWESFCNFCIEHIDSKFPKFSDAQSSCIDFVFSALTERKITETFEDLNYRCVAIPLFSALIGLRYLSERLIEITKELISTTKLWASASVSGESIEFVKLLLVELDNWRGPIRLDLEQLIFTILSNGVDVHRRIRDSSILEEACLTFSCGEHKGMDNELTSATYASERRVFLEIVKRANPEQLNEERLEYQFEYIDRLAQKGHHRGASWMIETLVTRGLDPNKCKMGSNGYPLLFSFLFVSATPAAISLLELGADPATKSIVESAGYNAFHWALARGNLEFIESLFARFAGHPTLWKETANVYFELEILEVTFDRLDALHISSFNGQIDCIRFLIDNGLFPNVASVAAREYNCLHFAALYGRVETIKYLSSNGLDVNQPAEDGSLPLHFAVRNGHEQAVDALIKFGSAFPPDCFGMTPLMYAEKLGYTNIQKLLETGQSRCRTPTTEGTHQVRRVTLKLLRQNLESAISKGDLEMCRQLMSQGLSMEVAMPSCGGCSPLLHAIALKKENIVSWLLGKRVSVLHVACKRHGELTVLRVCIEHTVSAKLMKQVLDVYSDTAEDLEMIVRSSFQAIARWDHATLRLVIEHIKQNLEKYRYVLS